MREYRVVVVQFLGRGWTQEIFWLREFDKKFDEWKGRTWLEFLNEAGREGWQLDAAVPVQEAASTVGMAAYFSRENKAGW